MGATIIISRELALRQESAAKVTEDRGPLIQVEINYIHRKIGE